jgi:hypothetical protein
MKKVGRNELCKCGSNKKYKNCCINKDIEYQNTQRQRLIYGDEYGSEELKELATVLKDNYPDHEVIDVSKVADESTYKPLQLQHYTKKVIMLLEKNDINKKIFEERCPEHITVMVLYRGAFECITGEVIDPVCDMIDTRLRNEVWQRLH